MDTPATLKKPLRNATPEEGQMVAQAVMEGLGLARLDLMPPKQYKGDMTLGEFAVNVRGIAEQLLQAAKEGKRLTRSQVNFTGEGGTTGYGSAWVVGAVEGEPPTVSMLFSTEAETKEIYDQLAAKHTGRKAPPKNRFKKRKE